VWPISTGITAIPDKPIFDYMGDGQLIFLNTHSDELLDIQYTNRRGRYIKEGLDDIDYILRCRLTDEMVTMDRKLISLIDHIQDHFDAERVEIVSGYRSPDLNTKLRRRSRRVAKNSLHLQGKAIDIRIPGVSAREIRDYAVSLKAGGVGYYGRRSFVHIDVGSVKSW
jgi:uncharacterized protein YcbK (DUF882 family)